MDPWNEISYQDTIDFFRSNSDNLRRLLIEPKIPDVIRTANGSAFSGMEGPCVLSRRLAYPIVTRTANDFFSGPFSNYLLFLSGFWTTSITITSTC